MKIVGLTGGIGSGKTTVAKIFEVLRVPIYYADDRAKGLYTSDLKLKNNIIDSFGEASYQNNKLNKTHLSNIVFTDKKKLKLLNSIIHPRVKIDFDNWKKEHQDSKYIIKEAAILIESNGHKACDHVVLVTAPQQVRIQRVMLRDKASEKQVLDRILNQLSDDEKRKYSDFEIDNSGEVMLIPQIMKIHKELSL